MPKKPAKKDCSAAKASALSKIDPKLHDFAASLEAQGFDWSFILILVQTVLAQVIEQLKRQPVSSAAKAAECDPAVKKAVDAAVQSAVQTLASVLCVAHCTGCCVIDHDTDEDE